MKKSLKIMLGWFIIINFLLLENKALYTYINDIKK